MFLDWDRRLMQLFTCILNSTRCFWLVLILIAGLSPMAVNAQDLKVLTTGAYKQMVLAMIPAFEAKTSHKVSMDNDTAGALIKRVKAGELFDVLILTPKALEDFAQGGAATVDAKTIVSIAKVGIGVAVREGEEKPPLQTVDDFLRVLQRAKKIAYIDPASGGSSGIYLAQLFDKKGWREMIAPKAVLINGGYVADALVKGQADLAIHQISEIVPVKGASLVGPLPEELQNYTIYAGAVSARSANPQAAREFLSLVSGPQAGALMREKGMVPFH